MPADTARAKLAELQALCIPVPPSPCTDDQQTEILVARRKAHEALPVLLAAIEALLAERDLRPAYDQVAEPELARAVEAADTALEVLSNA